MSDKEMEDEIYGLQCVIGNMSDCIRMGLTILNEFCDAQCGDTCPAWPDKSRQCRLRDFEDKVRYLGIVKVDE